MNLGDQSSLRGGGPCVKGHGWTPVAQAPGRPGFSTYHCRACGEWTTMRADGEELPERSAERRIVALEQRMTDMEAKIEEILALLTASPVLGERHE